MIKKLAKGAGAWNFSEKQRTFAALSGETLGQVGMLFIDRGSEILRPTAARAWKRLCGGAFGPAGD